MQVLVVRQPSVAPTLSLNQTFFVFFFRERTFTLTMRNGASGRRKASRLSTGTLKTETSSDLQQERTDERTNGRLRK